jgi:tetratricopeptide (TPR) repeat protein
MKNIRKYLVIYFLCMIGCGGAKPSIRDELNLAKEGQSSEAKEEQQAGVQTETRTTEIAPEGEKPVRSEKEAVPKNEEAKEVQYSGEPNDVAKKYFVDAQNAIKNGDLEDSKTKLEEAVKSKPDYMEANYNLALLSFLNRNYSLAKNYIDRCMRLKIASVKVPVLFVKIYTMLGLQDEAEKTLKDLSEKNENNVELKNGYLRYLIQTKMAHEALDIASNLLKKDEANLEVMKTIGLCYIALRKNDLAEFVFVNALEIKKDPEIYNLLANISLYKDDKKKAMSYFQSALELDPTLADAHNNLGVIYEEIGDYQGAISEFNLALKYFPTFAEASLNLGNAYRKNLEFVKARETYMDALKLDPSMAEAYFNLGILFIEIKEGEDKEQRYKQAIDYLGKYKDMKRGGLDKNDPVDKYIQEAKKLLEVAIEEAKQMKEIMQAPKEPPKEKPKETAPEGQQGTVEKSPAEVPQTPPEPPVPEQKPKEEPVPESKPPEQPVPEQKPVEQPVPENPPAPKEPEQPKNQLLPEEVPGGL